MGLFDFMKPKNDREPSLPSSTPLTPRSPMKERFVTPSSGVDLLDLSKGDILDLSKACDNFKKLRGAAGWGFKQPSDAHNWDLDIFAILLDEDSRYIDCVYYGDKHAKGIDLDHDDLTGGGDADTDNENIYMDLTKVSDKVNTIMLCVAIYDAEYKKQTFSGVKNAYVRLVDESAGGSGREICRYNLSDGGDNTAVICAEIFRSEGGWSFEAIGDYLKASIDDMKRSYKK